MLDFAIDGITSFSVQPLRMISVLGASFLFLSILALIVTLICGVFSGIVPVLGLAGFIGGIQLLCTGVLGTYIGKIYAETKSRPRFLIEEIKETR